jgi:GNAT superfamily N-acetyltransferase
MERIRLERTDTPDPAELQALENGINRYNVVRTGRTEYAPVAIFLRDEEGTAVGGLFGHLWGGWMHVTVLWVPEELRRQGYGTRLLQAAEEYAIERGCHAVFLETFSFQAPEFYLRFGYELFGSLEDYPPGHTQYFLRKSLVPRAL